MLAIFGKKQIGQTKVSKVIDSKLNLSHFSVVFIRSRGTMIPALLMSKSRRLYLLSKSLTKVLMDA
jgi:hypothetical protein